MLDLKRTRALMMKENVDALVASSHAHVFYSSDLPSVLSMPNRIMFSVMSRHPWAVSVIHKTEGEVLICPNAAAETAEASSWIKDVRTYATLSSIERPDDKRIEPIASTLVEALTAVLSDMGAKEGNIGIEKTKMPVSMCTELEKVMPKATFKEGDNIFVKLRSIKSVEEIRRIKRATEITEKAIESAMESIREGVSELELLATLKNSIFKDGGDWLHTTVSGGKYNSAAVYHLPSTYRVKKGDVIRFDIGAVYNGYASDLARVAVVGKTPAKVEKIYTALLNAQQDVVSKIRSGVLPSELFQIGLDKVRKAGYPTYARGMVGHGVGLEVEEFPMIAPTNNIPLESGMVLAVEVPRYICGLGGFNIEDIVLVTEGGHDVLSSMNRDIFVAH